MICSGGVFDKGALGKKLAELIILTDKPDLWDNPDAAQKLLQKKSYIEGQYNLIDGFQTEFIELKELFDLAELEGDYEALSDTVKSFEKLLLALDRAKFSALFNKPEDKSWEEYTTEKLNIGMGF